MSDIDIKKLRGLKALLQDAVIGSAQRIEQVHKATAARPFDVLAQIPGVAGPSEVVRAVHDAIVTTGYAATRAVTQVVGAGLDAALDAVEWQVDAAPTDASASTQATARDAGTGE